MNLGGKRGEKGKENQNGTTHGSSVPFDVTGWETLMRGGQSRTGERHPFIKYLNVSPWYPHFLEICNGRGKTSLSNPSVWTPPEVTGSPWKMNPLDNRETINFLRILFGTPFPHSDRRLTETVTINETSTLTNTTQVESKDPVLSSLHVGGYHYRELRVSQFTLVNLSSFRSTPPL